MNWRENLRVVALFSNVLMALFLVTSRGWFLVMGAFGIPLLSAPLLAILALALPARPRS